jgi:hypothetical protein
MFQKVANHFRYFRGAYLALAATVLTVAGLASFQPDEPFYNDDSAWLKASVLEAPKPNPYTNGEFVIDVVKRLKKADCFEALCADMKGGTLEERARCELEKRGVFDKPANYKWYDKELNRAEAIKTIVSTFELPMNDGATQPFKDVKAKTWYAPYVAAAVEGKLIKDNRTHEFKPEDAAKSAWARQIVKKADIKQMCAEQG